MRPRKAPVLAALAALLLTCSATLATVEITSYTCIYDENYVYNEPVVIWDGGRLEVTDGATVTFSYGLEIHGGGGFEVSNSTVKVGPNKEIVLRSGGADTAAISCWYGDFECSNANSQWWGITGLGNTWIRLRHADVVHASHAVWQGPDSSYSGFADIEYGTFATDTIAFWFHTTRASGTTSPIIKSVDIATSGDGYSDAIWVTNGSAMDIGAWGSWVDIEVSASADSACGIYVEDSEPAIIQADVTGGMYGVWLYCSDAMLNGCVIDGNDEECAGSKGLYVEGSDPTLLDCWLFGHDSTEIYLLPGCSADADLDMIEGENGVHTSSCDGTGTPEGTAIYAIYCGTGQDRTIDVSRNWWGCSSPPFGTIFSCSGNVTDSDPNSWQPSFGRASRVARNTSPWPDVAMLAQARNLETGGDVSSALGLYKNLVREYPDSPCAPHALTRARAAMLATGAEGADVQAYLETLLTSDAPGIAQRAEELISRFLTDTPCQGRTRSGRLAPAQAGAGEVAAPSRRSVAAIRFSPNPFNPTTTITYDVATAGNVEISIFNTAGQLVRRLVSNPSVAAGTYSAVWDGTDNSNRKLASGVYLVRLTTPGRSVTERLTMAY